MGFNPASEITLLESKINVNSIKNCSTLFYFYNLIFFLFITIVRFISAPDITTAKGKINVNGN